jgi:hypothetical protein
MNVKEKLHQRQRFVGAHQELTYIDQLPSKLMRDAELIRRIGCHQRGDTEVLKVSIVRHSLEDAPPHTFLAPATEAAEHAVPVADDV